MNVKTTIVLLILLILCAGYMLVFQAGWFDKDDKINGDVDTDKRLTGKAGEIRQLVLERSGGERISFARHDGKWHITEPIDAPAADWTVDAVARSVSSLQYVRKYAEDDPDCQDDLTHLSAPRHTVTFTDDKDKTFTIKVGWNPPLTTTGQTYVQLAGDKHVYVVETDLYNILDRAFTKYRLNYVARFKNEQARRITVNGDENYQLVKTDNTWKIDSPVQARTDQKKVEALLNAASGIRAENFIDDNPKNLAPYGLDNPRLIVTVELSHPTPTPSTQPTTQPKGKVISVVFGTGTDNKVFAKLADKPWVFQVDESSLTGLQPKLSDLRDKSILDAAGRDITKVEISLSAGAGGSATLEKDKGKWRMLSPFKGGCENSAVHKLLITLQSLKAGEFRDNPTAIAAFGLKPPQGKITLHFRHSNKTETLLLGRISDSGQMAFVMAAGSKSVAVISAADLAKLTKPSPAYWNRTISKLPEDMTVTYIHLQRPDGKFTIVETADGEYKLIKPVKAKTDAKNVDALLKAIGNIRADKIVALNKTLPKRFAKAKGIRVEIRYRKTTPATQPATTSAPATQTSQPTTQPVRPVIHIHQDPFVVIKDKGKTYVWEERIFFDASGGEFAVVIRPIVVGELPGSFYDKFAAEMRDRTVLKIDAKKIISLKMKLGKKSMEFVRAEKVWRYKADMFVKIDASKIEKFLAGLSGIKAKRFVDYSPKPKLNRFSLDKPAMILTLKTDKGKEITLKIARTGPVGTRGLYAVSSESPGVFVLAPETSAKMSKSLKDFQGKDGK
ncbi:MAG: DUF4340 domain-containing protein [Phycisphaerae bacterium]|nr:DUF4340 domain-containing protein [Phycisphaerae bacterium]